MKNLVKYILLLNGLGVLFLFSCSYEKIDKEIPGVNSLSLSTNYRINLPEEHLSGYTWQLIDSYDKTIVDNTSAVWHGNNKGVDYNFKTLAVGQTTLTFILRKYTDTSSIKHFIVHIGGK